MLMRMADGSLVGRVKVSADTASGGRRGTIKTCGSVSRGERGLYAASGGEMLGDGEHDLPVGTVIAEVGPGGSQRSPTKTYRVAAVNEAGDLAYLWNGTSHPQFCDAMEAQFARGDALRAESEALAALAPGQIRGDYLRGPDRQNGVGTKVVLIHFGGSGETDLALAAAVRAYAESGSDWGPVFVRRAELAAAKDKTPTLTALREQESGQALSRRLKLERQREELLTRLAAIEAELTAMTPILTPPA